MVLVRRVFTDIIKKIIFFVNFVLIYFLENTFKFFYEIFFSGNCCNFFLNILYKTLFTTNFIVLQKIIIHRIIICQSRFLEKIAEKSLILRNFNKFAKTFSYNMRIFSNACTETL